ncbi:cupin domain-containing protein [uncultured Tateyamaria sp.]|uniref:cupin domain-containing protein n=1 Tax=uncultured Tateyamaria sp. TaxID=455651 RepID=UPI0026073708|nr:cupin domain-containing protein [uncultured Tateyamaria sp.]
MIARKNSVAKERIDGTWSRTEQKVGAAFDLMHLGANVVTLAPGETSSDRHWHRNSDEILVLLEGEATVIEDDGAHVLTPGDIAVWPAGAQNAHHVKNMSAAPVVYFVVGSLPETDLVRYPDSGETLFHEPPNWRLVADDGTVLRQGRTDD